jgi:hypothetical protein
MVRRVGGVNKAAGAEQKTRAARSAGQSSMNDHQGDDRL